MKCDIVINKKTAGYNLELGRVGGCAKSYYGH